MLLSHLCTHSSPCSLGAGTNSKHVDLKLTKLVDVSPRRGASPSSPSSTSSSSSPTASSTSPVSPAEGQEVCKRSILFTLFLSVFSFYPFYTIKGAPDRSGPTDPRRQPTDPLYTSVGRTTSSQTVVYSSCVRMCVPQAKRLANWNHESQRNMWQPLPPFTMTFSDNECLCKKGLLLHASATRHVNIESTTSSRPVL